jgi:putative oxidoreductase
METRMTQTVSSPRHWCSRALALSAWAIGILFVISALTKISAPAGFALAVKHFKLLPLWAVNIPALLLPWCELVAGLALLTVRWRCAGAVMVFGMLCSFIVAIVAAMARDLDITCGCFGEASGKAGILLLSLDLLLAVLCVWLIVRASQAAEPVVEGGNGGRGCAAG